MKVGKKEQRDATITERRKQVANLYLNRVKEDEIADKLGVVKSTISKDIKALKAQWYKESQEDISKQISRELAELDLMELEANVQYQAAKKAGKDVFMIKWKETQLKIKDRRAKLLGLDNPSKLDVNVKTPVIVKFERKTFRKEDDV